MTDLHHRILAHFVEHGRAPTVAELAAGGAREDVERGLDALAAEHGVVLHPSREVWIAHPFSAAPTATWIERADGRGWWAPCLWCALGISTLAAPTATIHARLAGEREPLVIEVAEGRATPDLLVHFPIPPRDAWSNVVHWCSTVLPFAREADVAPWCARHGVPLGAVVPLAQVHHLAQRWYGRHLDREWRKWTLAEAQDHFTAAGLVGEHWQLPAGDGRY